jgi:hypothetical protein
LVNNIYMPATAEELAAICRQWTPQSLATFYEWTFAGLGWKMPKHLWPVCLALCDSRIEKLMLNVGPGTGKSQLLSVVYPAWVLGHDPSMTILGVSGGESLMQGFQAAAAEIIQSSSSFQLSYPKVKPDKNAGWSAERGLFVSGRKPGIPDASYLAAGLQSRYLVGKHARLLVVDDLHDDTNSGTAEQCETVVRKWYNTILGRADPMGARFIIAGRRWHEADVYGQLKVSGDWVTMTLPAERAGKKGLYFDITVPDNFDCVFTDRLVVCKDDTVISI